MGIEKTIKLKDILSLPLRDEGLTKRFGPTAQSWDDVKSFDDCVIKEEKYVISEIEKERQGQERCPYLGKKGKYFYFCKERLNHHLKNKSYTNDNTPSLGNAVYHSKIGHFELQLWCLCGKDKYKNCINYKENKYQGAKSQNVKA